MSVQMLSAHSGSKVLTIGFDPMDELRHLSSRKELQCPVCGSVVILRAASVRTPHFAHLPNAVCSAEHFEPETEEHLSGKLLLARWLRDCLPNAEVIVEAYLPQTGQRADVLVRLETPKEGVEGIAFEFQCASLSAEKWKHRHKQYQSQKITDIWILGGSRLSFTTHPSGSGELVTIKTTTLERTLLAEGHPLLFFHSIKTDTEVGKLIRFRPKEPLDLRLPSGSLIRRLLTLSPFPWNLVEGERKPPVLAEPPINAHQSGKVVEQTDEDAVKGEGMREWIQNRYRFDIANLPEVFDAELPHDSAIPCTPRTWRAAVYFRFIHQQVGFNWSHFTVVAWAEANLPQRKPFKRWALQRLLLEVRCLFVAVGFLLPHQKLNLDTIRVTGDLLTIHQFPQREEAERLVRIRLLPEN